MRILCFVIPEKGHLNPLLPTLRRLAEAGHEVTVAAARDLTPVLRAAGLNARAELLDVPPPPPGFVTAGQLFAEKLRDSAWLAGWIEALLIDAVPGQLPAVTRLLVQQRPDVVVADPMMYAVAIACAELALPWAALSSSLNPVTPVDWSTPLTQTLERLRERRAQLFQARGLPVPRFFVSDAESPWLNIAFTVRDYLPQPAHPAIQLVGAPFDRSDISRRGDEPAFPWHRLRDRSLPAGSAPFDGKRLYCSFGSQAFYQPRLFQRVFAAAEALGLQVVASVGDLLDDARFVASAPKSAVLVRYSPQLALLEEVDVVVSHGGANSVVETLAAGLPLLLLTLCNDQPLQARFLVASGAGQALDAARGDVAEHAVRTALQQLLSGPWARRAQQLGAALRAAGGPAQAAQLIVQLGETRRPNGAESTEAKHV